MGFTRYWTYDKPFKPLPDSEWNEFKRDVRKILKNNKDNLNIPLSAGSHGENRGPIIGRDYIVLNGVDEDMHEDLLIQKDPTPESLSIVKYSPTQSGFRFCKTGRKPYDFIVWNILQAFGDRFKNSITIDSD